MKCLFRPAITPLLRGDRGEQRGGKLYSSNLSCGQEASNFTVSSTRFAREIKNKKVKKSGKGARSGHP